MAGAQENKARLLNLLQELEVEYELFEHPPVLTVEEQEKHVGHVGGGLSKNLLLKDKKGRLILVSALASTKVDLKGLSARIGAGKGGLRMAPEDTLAATLQVPLGCVTPFALLQETSRQVATLFDVGFKSHSKILFHPLSNDATIAVTPGGLEKFFSSINREAHFVDLEAEVLIDKDHPPDLAPYLVQASVDSSVSQGGEGGGEVSETRDKKDTSGAKSGPDSSNQATSKAPKSGPDSSNQATSKAPKSGPDSLNQAVSKTASTVSTSSGKGKTEAERSVPSGDNVPLAVSKTLKLFYGALDSVVKASGGIGKEGDVTLDTQQQLEKHLTSDLEHLLVMFKNAAYTQGFMAAQRKP